MVTMNTLTFIIAAFCGFKGNASKEQKIACAEYMVNCSIVADGKTTDKLINECREKWLTKTATK